MTTNRLRTPAPTRTLRFGDTTVAFVPDGVVQLPGRGWLPDTTDEVWAAHPEYLDETGHLTASIGALLVTRDDRTLLIDAGVGKVSMQAQPGSKIGAIEGGALLDNLAALGHQPTDIEAVALTHLHMDHTGWLTAFTEARYLITEPEWTNRAHGTDANHATLDAIAPRVHQVSDEEEIFPGVHVLMSPGHTAGHATYVITAGDQRILAFGDAMHSPIQVANPDWVAASDHDRAQAVESRRRLVNELTTPNTIGFGIHFADVQFGQVTNGAWQPLPH
ncbi:MAG: MBL fold metallo-hydrolase [Actinophytocola sp.]|uniref:MBL fold metallo-hydrolase n=1 Tax=Actinophytocola sp. TaxID=1872138 RepID=UPI003C78FA8E